MPGYIREGSEFVVNTTYARSQAQPDSTRLANGNYIVCWTDADFNTTAGRFIRAQIFQPDGTPVGGELTLYGPVNHASYPQVVALSSGGFVTFYNAVSGTVGQAYDAAGVAIGSQFTVTTTFASNVDAVALANGGYAVVWEDSRTTGSDTSGSGVRVTTYDQNGAVVSSDVLVNTVTSGNQFDSAISALTGGGYVVTWSDLSGSTWKLKAQVFDAAGAKLGGELLLGPDGGSSAVTALANGNFAVTWSANGENLIQIFSASGTPVGAPITFDAGDYSMQGAPQLTALSNGGLVVTWVATDYAVDPEISADGSGTGIFFQAFDAAAQPLGGPQLVNSMLAGDQIQPTVTALDNGAFVINWTDLSAPGADNDQIHGQIFSFDASNLPVTEVAITSAGAGATATVQAVENDRAVTFVTAEAPSGSPAVVYSITGGADAALFTINAATGLVRYAAMPDFETPLDANADNLYELVVTASDGTTSDSQAITVQLLDMNDAPTITSPASFSLVENTVAAGTVTASDLEGDAVIYSIAGGLDSARFQINSTTGAISFWSAPNYEAPNDSNLDGVYNLVVRATDANGSVSALQTVTITVSNVLEGTTITSNGGGATAALTLAENTAIATTVVASDFTGSAVTYAISGGADAAKFTIYAATGVLSFVTPPNYETPNDSGLNRVYDVTVTASDGLVTDSQALAITIANLNEAPVITSNGGGATASVSLTETSTYVGMVSATDPENNPRTYSIVGGADAAKFAITASGGILTFITGPNFEAPGDANGDNVYEVIIAASDGSLADTQTINVTILNVNEAPVVTSPGSFSVAENTLAVGTITGTDVDSPALTYLITGGVDAARFAINAATGALSFVANPNFEAPSDVGINNVYNITIGVRDGALTTSQSVAITVTNVNETPTITSNGGGASASLTVAENGNAVTTVTATDPENTARVYAIAGGADAALFAIHAGTGVLTFIAAPDFDAPGEAGADNVYDVVVSASDGVSSDTQALAIAVTNVNEAPVITSNGGGAIAAVAVSEGTAAVATVTAGDPDNTAPTFAITGGGDAALFAIDAATGELSFIAAPDFEAPSDAGGDNVYDVTVTASDGSLSGSQAISVTVGNANEAAMFTSPASFAALENALAAGTIVASDPDGDALAFAIAGGADAALFAIDAATGVLTFVAEPNFEAPGDAGGNNVYDVTVSASDGSLTTLQTVSVTLGNVNEAPTITSNGGGDSASIARTEGVSLAVTTVTSSDPDGNPRTYAITGGSDAARFTINAATGQLIFVASPDYEAPTDSNGDNVYQVIVTASDGALSDSQTIAVTIGNANESLAITSNGGGDTASITVNENTAAVTTVTAIDPDGTAPAYAITGGADAARFTINAATGALSFVAAPNYEAPTDSNGDNVYQVEVRASDGTYGDYQMIAVTVANVVDGVTLTGTSKANNLTGTVAEDTINGLGGADTLNGGAGADTINGGDGNDQIIGGGGADVLSGGAGADTFVYQSLADSSAAVRDFLTDFAAQDRISLSAIDANANLGGDQAFAWIGTAAFGNVAGQLRSYQSGGNTYVTGDVNGDGVGDFQIEMDPLVTLAASNFIL